MKEEEEAIRKLIAEGEGTHLEFKTSFNAEVITTLVAMANHEGGQVVVGVDPKHRISGVEINPGRLIEPLTIEKLLSGNYSSVIRNKKIAFMFKEAGNIESYG